MSVDWETETFPNDLGDGNHRWSWLVRANDEGQNRKDIMWLHTCADGRRAIMWIDITSGEFHRLESDDPLTVSPSILCPLGCGDHGYIREGEWAAA